MTDAGRAGLPLTRRPCALAPGQGRMAAKSSMATAPYPTQQVGFDWIGVEMPVGPAARSDSEIRRIVPKVIGIGQNRSLEEFSPDAESPCDSPPFGAPNARLEKKIVDF